MQTDIELDFADGRYRFWLGLAQAIELEDKHGSICGLEPRLRDGIGLDEKKRPVFVGGGSAETAACREVVRLALIGGNRAVVDGEEREVGPIRAKQLVDAYAYPQRPIGETAALAWRILAAAIYGHEPEAEKTAAESEPADG